MGLCKLGTNWTICAETHPAATQIISNLLLTQSIWRGPLSWAGTPEQHAYAAGTP